MVAAAIILSAIITVASVFYAVVFPELMRRASFEMLQDAEYELPHLLEGRPCTLRLSKSVGLLSFSSSVSSSLSYRDAEVSNVTLVEAFAVEQKEERFEGSGSVSDVSGVESAYLLCSSISEGVVANITFYTSQGSLVCRLATEAETIGSGSWIRATLSLSPGDSYRFTLQSGDALSINLFDPLFNASDYISNAHSIEYDTSGCQLYLRYSAAEEYSQSFIASGALSYKNNYLGTECAISPIGVVTFQGDRSSLVSPSITWDDDELVVELYNLSNCSFSALGGSGSVTLKSYVKEVVSKEVVAKRVELRVLDSRYENAFEILEQVLAAKAPEGVVVCYNNQVLSIYREDGENVSLSLRVKEVSITY